MFSSSLIVTLCVCMAFLPAATAAPDSERGFGDSTSHQTAMPLNRVTFKGNVLDGAGGAVDHWIVYYCVSWMPLCEGLMDDYRQLSHQYDEKFNSERLLSLGVRFAYVDCATEKVLCNQNGVTDYPYMAHYHDGNVSSRWSSGADSLQGLQRSLREFVHQTLATVGVKSPLQPLLPSLASLRQQYLPGSFRDWGRVLVATCFAASLLVWCARAIRVMTDAAGGQPLIKNKSPQETEDCEPLRRRHLPREWGLERRSFEL